MIATMSTFEKLVNNQEKFEPELLSFPNVVGVGVGKKIKGGVSTSDSCYSVLVRKKKPLSLLKSSAIVPKEVNGFITDIVEVGSLVIHDVNTGRVRPPQPGCSMGHYHISAGTFGGIVYDNATGEKLILSNNHVLANTNDAYIGDPILQPGSYDGGAVPEDVVATLYRFVPIVFPNINVDSPPVVDDSSRCVFARSFAWFGNFIAKCVGSSYRVHLSKKPSKIKKQSSQVNLVDAAVAKPTVYASDEIFEIGKVNGINVLPFIDMHVQKYGRTSGYTRSVIKVLNATVRVAYDDNMVATFVNQIVAGAMSMPGDSGSLVLDMNNKAVGLLFGGSDQATLINPISAVLSTLDIRL